MAIDALTPGAGPLAAALLLDLAFGDPVYAWHPVRLMGRSLAWFEERLRALGFDGRGGGILLFLLLAGVWGGGTSLLVAALARRYEPAAVTIHVLLVYSLVALHDLLRHAWAVERAASRGDTDGARQAISRLVGRDTDRMDIAACRRAAVESLSENLTDGFVSALFWYTIGGLPGLVVFKVVSTMDSMVGYKTPRYFYFGWCGARLDDLMNYVPARLTWLLTGVAALVIPGCSPKKALVIGWQQHGLVPGPNSGWSEAAAAGGLNRRLAGPIWSQGNLVNALWLGDPGDPAVSESGDLRRAMLLIGVTAAMASAIGLAALC